MKKRLIFFMIIFVGFFFKPLLLMAEESNITYEDAINMVQEEMKSYYIRGPYIQYNYSKAIYGNLIPEDATSQDNKYVVCAAFTYNIYTNSFGMDYSTTSNFPRYNYNIVEAAYDKYYSVIDSTYTKYYKNNNNNNLDGSFLIYYQSTTTSDGTYNSGSKIRKREKIKYLYGDKDSSSDGDIETLVKNVQPGDLLAYTGHALIVYDTIDTDGDGIKDDILILESVQSPFIRTRISSTSKLSYNLFKANANNNVLDIDTQGTITYSLFSDSSFVSDGKLNCTKDECAIIRPFYKGINGNAVFNYNINESKYKKTQLRTQYPGLFIEKIVNVGDNNSVYIGDELTYIIKITNKSGVNYKPQKYNKFYIKEVLDSDVDYVSSNDAQYDSSNKSLIWSIDNLAAGDTIELTYTVKVKNDVDLVGNVITSNGIFSSSLNSDISLSTGTVDNKIIPKVTKYKDTYSNCYEKMKNSYTGMTLLDKIYSCSLGKDFNFDEFEFEKLFLKEGTTKLNVKINFQNNLNDYYNDIKDMILNDYLNGLFVIDEQYVLPRWISNIPNRAKTINSIDFKEGDMLIYSINNSKYTNEDGVYAYIYLDGKFVGINGQSNRIRNVFDYNYYNDNNLDLSKNLYSASTNLNFEQKETVLDFVNYQTLFDKDYYMILRPEQVIEEVIEVKINKPTKQNYIQNYENIDYSGGSFTIVYNYGKEVVKLDNSEVRKSGFDNSKLGKNTISVEYQGQTATFDVEIISKQINKIEIIETPTKVKYIQNHEDLDLTGGIIKVLYNDETTDTISMSNDNVLVKGFDNSKLGKNTITVEYQGHISKFDVEIILKRITKVEIENVPTKLNYIQNYEDLDLTGGIIKVLYNDETIDYIEMDNDNVEIEGFDNSKLGINTITVEYQDYVVLFDVEIISKKISKIEIKTKPIKLNYIQNYEKLDLTGGIIKVIYNDNTEDSISMTNENVIVSGFDNSKLGVNTVSIKYQGYKTTMDVMIVENNIQDNIENPKTGMSNIYIVILIAFITLVLGNIFYKKIV